MNSFSLTDVQVFPPSHEYGFVASPDSLSLALIVSVLEVVHSLSFPFTCTSGAVVSILSIVINGVVRTLTPSLTLIYKVPSVVNFNTYTLDGAINHVFPPSVEY